MSILIFFLVLLLLVIVHECGHFLVAKMSRVRVDEFAFGFPPRLWSIKKGETTYSFNIFPIGGYVKIYGENLEDENRQSPNERSLAAQPRYIQAAVISAGVLFNLLLAWILITSTLLAGIYAPSGADTGYVVSNPRLMITEIEEKSPAASSGLRPGDVILGLSDDITAIEPKVQDDVTNFMTQHEGIPIQFRYERRGNESTITITPVSGISPSGAAIGVYMDIVGVLRLPFWQALKEGFVKTVQYTELTMIGIGEFIWNIMKGQSDFSGVSGPVGIVHVAGEAMRIGFSNMLLFAALISINLAVVNFIPFPALDGGRLLFVIIEGLIKRKVNPKVFHILNQVGFVLLLLLMIIVTYHDISKLI